MLLYGKRSVLERMKANAASIINIIMQEGANQPEISRLAGKHNIRIRRMPARRFFKIAKRIQAQGVIAEVEQFHYHNYEQLITRDEKPNLIYLDRITDPQNLGAIFRTCACLGDFAIILPRHESAQINQTVLKVACGAENYTPVCLVKNLSSAIKQAKAENYTVYGTVINQGEELTSVKFTFPLGLIFGSEGQGIRPGLIEHIDHKLTLPMKGAEISLNVSMACGIFCYEVLRQKCQKS